MVKFEKLTGSSHLPHCSEHPASSRSPFKSLLSTGCFAVLPPALHFDEFGGFRSLWPVAWRVAQPDTAVAVTGWRKIINTSNLSKYYFQDIPAYVMDEIVTGMIDGKPEPTPEEMDEWFNFELEREAETLLANIQ